jgi:hypothetical protein
MGFATSKTVEIAAPRRSLTPCILDDDAAQLEVLSAVIAMGDEPIPTSDPAEALQLVKREGLPISLKLLKACRVYG